MKLTKIAAAISIAATIALAATSSQAGIVNVGGVIWDTESPFDFSSQGDTTESVVSTIAEGDIKGFGKFTFFNRTEPDVFCPGCELTYEFSNYTLTADITSANFGFSGGLLNIYVGARNYSALNPSSAADGVLFLSLEGSTAYFASIGYSLDETLVGTLTDPSDVGAGGRGTGYLDVTGGIAESYFDTNGQPGGADITYSAIFFPEDGFVVVGEDGTRYTNRGVITAVGVTQEVPEPGALALMGLGLAGLGFARRKQNKV